MTGVIDALALAEEGGPDVVIDWKTDVRPHTWGVAEYKAQVHSYLRDRSL